MLQLISSCNVVSTRVSEVKVVNRHGYFGDFHGINSRLHFKVVKVSLNNVEICLLHSLLSVLGALKIENSTLPEASSKVSEGRKTGNKPVLMAHSFK